MKRPFNDFTVCKRPLKNLVKAFERPAKALKGVYNAVAPPFGRPLKRLSKAFKGQRALKSPFKRLSKGFFKGLSKALSKPPKGLKKAYKKAF